MNFDAFYESEEPSEERRSGIQVKAKFDRE
jgi:hypothetical protein